MKVGIYFFSGTGVTGQFASRMESIFNHKNVEARYFDITPLKNRKPDLEEFDLYLFGFPVYSGVIPSVTRDWVKTLDGKGKHCALFFTYGGVTMGVAHYHTKLMLEEQGFKVIGSSEFPGRHTFNVAKGFEFLPDRPNDDDFSISDEYVDKLIDKLKSKKFDEITIEKPEEYDKVAEMLKNWKKSPARIVPTRNGKECRLCGDCEEFCATGAFNHETGEADPLQCISCLHCTVICRDQVIVLNNDMTDLCNNLTEYYNLSEEILEKRKSIYFV
ncbi:MAG: EFR1 family ferrodoxin [Candidatus Heimdallarchaeota archaeon]